jgi:alkylhydroperoxidase family enzyme
MHVVHDIDDVFLARMLAVFTESEFIELGMVIAQFIAMGQFVSMLRIPNPSLVPPDDND